jgi:hypothetical protein
MRTAKDIEALLRWAYRDELPKEAAGSGIGPIGCASAWGGVERYGELMTLIDAPENRWGVVPIGGSETPHPDAVRIGEAVLALDGYEVTLPDGWEPLADLRGLGPDGERLLDACVVRAWDRVTMLAADGRARVLREKISGLVRRCAILGRAPCWEADAPRVETVKGERGRERWFRRVVLTDMHGMPYEAEVDGYDHRAKRPYADAYRKHVLEPDPLDAAIGRAQYEVWVAALDLLAAELAGRLEAFEPLPANHPARPWETGEALAQRRVLPDTSAADQANRYAGQWFSERMAWRRKRKA